MEGASSDDGEPLAGVITIESDAEVVNLDSDGDGVAVEKGKDDESSDKESEDKESEEPEAGGSKDDEKSEGSKKNKKKKDKGFISDEDHFAAASPKELKHLRKNLIAEDELNKKSIICTACYKQVNYKQEGAVFRHTDLGVPICKKCRKFYHNGEWTKDDEGYYEHCRWCANGGDLLCCDSCPNSYCKKCIKRNLGRSKVSEIEGTDEWQCLTCDPKQIQSQRALYYSIWTYNVKEARTEEEMFERAKGRENSKFVDDAHKEGFEVIKILNNYLQKSNKSWKQKCDEQPLQEDVTKLVVKFRTIIKIAHHNLELLDKNLVDKCQASYPEVTESMLEAMEIPDESVKEEKETLKKKKKKVIKEQANSKEIPEALDDGMKEKDTPKKKRTPPSQRKIKKKENESKVEDSTDDIMKTEAMKEETDDTDSMDNINGTAENGHKEENSESNEVKETEKSPKKGSSKKTKSDDNASKEEGSADEMDTEKENGHLEESSENENDKENKKSPEKGSRKSNKTRKTNDKSSNEEGSAAEMDIEKKNGHTEESLENGKDEENEKSPKKGSRKSRKKAKTDDNSSKEEGSADEMDTEKENGHTEESSENEKDKENEKSPKKGSRKSSKTTKTNDISSKEEGLNAGNENGHKGDNSDSEKGKENGKSPKKGSSKSRKMTKKYDGSDDELDKEKEIITKQKNDDDANVSKDMFDSSDGEEVKKASELDEANQAARASLLNTSSEEESDNDLNPTAGSPDAKDEDGEKEAGENVPKLKLRPFGQMVNENEESDNGLNSSAGSPADLTATDEVPLVDLMDQSSENEGVKKEPMQKQEDDEKEKGEKVPKLKLRPMGEILNKTNSDDDIKASKTKQNGTTKEAKKGKRPKSSKPTFSASDSDDSDADRLGIEGGSPEKKESKKEEKKRMDKEEKKNKERLEKREMERLERKKLKDKKIKESAKKSRKEADDLGGKPADGSSDDEMEGGNKKKKKREKKLKKLRRKADAIDLSTAQLSKLKTRINLFNLKSELRDELKENDFVKVSNSSGKEKNPDGDIDKLCNFGSLKAVRRDSDDTDSDEDEEKSKASNGKNKTEKKEKKKKVGDMSSGSDNELSDGDESDDEPKKETAKKTKVKTNAPASSSDSDGEASDDSTLGTEEKKEKKEKKLLKKKAKANKSDEDENDSEKKPKVKKMALLSMKLSETDSSEDERKYHEKMAKKKASKKGEQDDSTDSSDVDAMSSATLHGSAKKKLLANKGKKRKAIVDSDSQANNSGSESEDEDDDDDDSDSDGAPKKPATKKRGRKKKSSSSDDDSDEKDRPKTKRRRIKKGSDDSDKEDDEEEASPTKRHNIKKVIKEKNLADDTKTAAAEEKERRQRVSERQERYNKSFGNKDGEELEKDAAVTEVVLDFDEDTKEILVEVDKRLVKKLKPHQARGVKFMWDSCFESLAQIKAEKIPGGAILGHCMGLGKTLQSVTLIHTIMDNDKIGVKRVMVMCPVNVVKNWAEEFDKWLIGNLEVDVFEMSGEKDNRARADKLESWFREGGVLLIGYDMFRNLTNPQNKKFKNRQKETFRKCLLDPGADLVICDEGHLLKNEKSAINAAVNRIKTPRRIVLTGTPLQNNLKEYYEMVNFVKPSLMGTRKEFMNRFVNPIVNGQHTDSTERDVRMMKKRSFLLNDLLKGCMQRLDYNVLVPYLMPKLEYVLAIQMTDFQKTLYKYYLENYAKAGQIGPDGKLMGGKKGGLFYDVQNLSRVWNHPYILLLSKMRKDAKDENDESGEEGSLKDFIADGTTSEESSAESSDDSDASSDDSAPKKRGRPKKRATRADKPTDLATLDDKEVVAKISGSNAWWNQFLKDDQDLDDVMLGSKMVLLMDILKECAMIGDKLLVFSQSILSLDLIEEFLERIHNENETKKKSESDVVDDALGTWVPGKDYYRMDGTTAAETRKIWCKFFNKADNHRMRLFLISTKAGGLGINLVAANRVIIFDASWNPSHDVQSIFRVFRFGQTKPVYVYRFIAKGTMEEKIYDRQVTKESLSARVVDEHQIDSHFTMNELAELYEFKDEPPEARPTPIVPEDRLLAELVDKHKALVWNIHKHDSLLENKVDENLTEAERKEAWAEFENEKKGYVERSSNMPDLQGSMQLLQQMQQQQQQQINPMAIQALLRQQYPDLNHEELMARTRWTIMELQKQHQQQLQHMIQQQAAAATAQQSNMMVQQQRQQQQQRMQQQMQQQPEYARLLQQQQLLNRGKKFTTAQLLEQRRVQQQQTNVQQQANEKPSSSSNVIDID